MQDRQAWNMGVLCFQNSSCLNHPPGARTVFRGRGRCKVAGARTLNAAELSNCSEAGAECKPGSSKDSKARRPAELSLQDGRLGPKAPSLTSLPCRMGPGSHWPAPTASHCNRCLPAALSAGQSAGEGCQAGTAHALARRLCGATNRRLHVSAWQADVSRSPQGCHAAGQPAVCSHRARKCRAALRGFLPLELAPPEGSLLCTQPQTLPGGVPTAQQCKGRLVGDCHPALPSSKQGMLLLSRAAQDGSTLVHIAAESHLLQQAGMQVPGGIQPGKVPVGSS